MMLIDDVCMENVDARFKIKKIVIYFKIKFNRYGTVFNAQFMSLSACFQPYTVSHYDITRSM